MKRIMLPVCLLLLLVAGSAAAAPREAESDQVRGEKLVLGLLGMIGSEKPEKVARARRLLALQPDAAAITAGFGSIEYWVDRLGSGISSRQDVLLSVFRLANARDLLLSEAQIVTLYRAFFNLLPDAGGIAYWRKVSAMPERLIEVLYYAPEFRRRFGG